MCSVRIFKLACPLFGFSCSFHFSDAVSPVVSSFRCMDCPAAPAHGLDCRTPIASIRSSIRSRSTSQNFSAERRSRSGASTSAASSRSLGWRCHGRERLFDFRSLRVDFVNFFSVTWFPSRCSLYAVYAPFIRRYGAHSLYGIRDSKFRKFLEMTFPNAA